MPAHIRRGASLAAMLLLLAVTATPLIAHGQAASRVWSTYLGGRDMEHITGIAQSPSNGNAVAVGWTNSADFPTRTAPGNDTGKDAFVATFTTLGSPVTEPFFFFGGAGDDIIHAVALGPEEHIYVVGMTQTDAMPQFSVHYNRLSGSDAAFLARLTKDGTPEWIMYLDSSGSETATGVTVSGTDIYVTGYTDSCDFLGTSSPCLGLSEGFVVKVDTSTRIPGISWRTLVTGNLKDSLIKPLVDGSNVLVVGSTTSTFLGHGSAVKNFPQGGSDALAAGLNAATGEVIWVEYLGGTGEDHGAGIVAGANGEIVVVGTVETTSQAKNVFATRMNSAGVIQGTRNKGGTGDEVASSAAVDASGNIYIGGKTLSTDFPLPGAFDSIPELAFPPQEGFVMVLPAQEGPGWASFVGGDGIDDVLALSIQGNRLVVAGETSSSAELVIPATYAASLSTPPDGFILAVNAVDITPPEAGTVNDRPGNDNVPADISTQTSTDTISANWTGFTDGETVIDRYEWAIGTSPGAENVWPFTGTSFSFQTSFTKTGLTLNAGTTYYTTVRAINGAGLTVTASSNGVRVGPPVVTDGGTNGGPDGGSDGGTNGGGPDGGGSDEKPEEGKAPLMGWSCTVADAGLPMLLGLLALMLLARRRGSQPR